MSLNADHSNNKSTSQVYSTLRPAADKRLDLVQASPIPYPLTLYIEPTNICNFKCVYCPESFDDYKEQAGGLHKLDLETFKQVGAQITELCGEGGLKRLFFHMMGEPFVNKQLVSFVETAKQNNLAEKVFITTNGSLLNETAARQVVHSGLDYLRLSVYGTDQENFNQRTRSPIDLNRIVENIHRLRQIRDAESPDGKPFIYVKMLDGKNEVENAAFFDLFSGAADEIALEQPMNWNEDTEKGLSQMDANDMLAQDLFQYKKKACSFPFFSLVIHADLQVSVCCVDWAKKAVVGNLRHNTLKEIWNGDALHTFRLKHLQGRRHEYEACKNCTFLYTHPDNLDALDPALFEARAPEPHKIWKACDPT